MSRDTPPDDGRTRHRVTCTPFVNTSSPGRDAPRREVAEQQKRDETERVAHSNARIANKFAFRF